MRSIILLCVALLFITLIVYWHAGNNQFLNFDDNVYVTENVHVQTGISGANVLWAFTSVYAANWHPLTWLSHMADVQLYGLDPRGHHLTNVFIHAISTLLLFLLLYRLTSSKWRSLFVAALFALHPLHVESVAWVAERKDVLSAFFCIITLLLYAEYAIKRKPALYFLTLLFFILGLMAKPMLVTLPVVMLLLDYWPLNRYRSSPLITMLKEKTPFFIVALLSCAVTIYAQQRGGAIKSFDMVPFGLRIENAVLAYVKYIAKTLWPLDLAVAYPLPKSFALWQVICALFFLLLVSTAAVRARRSHPYVMVGWIWFIATLVPVIGLIQVGGQSMADRYSYIPHIGLFILPAWGVPDIMKHLRYSRPILALLAGSVIIASAVLTWQQLAYWQNNISLYQHAIQVTSGNDLAHYNLAVANDDLGHIDEAIKEYKEALKINPHHIPARNNLDLDTDLKNYLEVVKTNPNLTTAHYNLGVTLESRGDLDAAIRQYQRAIKINPGFISAHYNLGNALARKGDLDAAIKEFRNTLEINPTSFAAHNNLGTALEQQGDLEQAIEEFRFALKIKPNYFDAHNNLAVAFHRKGDLDAAIAEYQAALAINPKSIAVNNNLAVALDQKTRNASAGR